MVQLILTSVISREVDCPLFLSEAIGSNSTALVPTGSCYQSACQPAGVCAADARRAGRCWSTRSVWKTAMRSSCTSRTAFIAACWCGSGGASPFQAVRAGGGRASLPSLWANSIALVPATGRDESQPSLRDIMALSRFWSSGGVAVVKWCISFGKMNNHPRDNLD